jgi:glutamyl-tRNA synthetase
MFYQNFEAFDDTAAHKHLRPVAETPLEAVQAALLTVTDWTPAELDDAVRETAEELELGLGKIAQPLRVALAGSGVSPSIDQTLWLVGRERSLARIERALTYVRNRAALTD